MNGQWWLVAGALLLGACGKGEPDDVLYVMGEVADERGQPLAGFPLTLERRESPGFGCARTVYVPPDAGTLPPEFHQVAEATTDAQGRFLFERYRYEMQGMGAFASPCYRVRPAAPAAGARAETMGWAGRGDLLLPTLAVWTSAAGVEAAGEAGVSVRHPGVAVLPAEEPGGPPETRLNEWWVETPDGALAWLQPAEGEEAVLAPELLEDFAGLSVRRFAGGSAWQERGDISLFTSVNEVTMSTASPPTPVPPLAARVPASRGAQCAIGGVPFPDGCPLTDGALARTDLQKRVSESAAGGPLPEADVLEVWWTEPLRPRLLVLRGLVAYDDGALHVEGSADGQTWELLAEEPWPQDTMFYNLGEVREETGRYLALPLSPTRGLTRLRVRVTAAQRPGTLVALRELSLFD